MRSRLLGPLVFGLAAPLALLPAQEKVAAPDAKEVKVTVVTTAPAPPVSITLHERAAEVTPARGKLTHTGGGLIDVATPSPDTVVVTTTGAVLANAEMKFQLQQCFEVSFDDPKVKKAKLSLEGRVTGLLRGERQGCAEYADACAHVSSGHQALLNVCVPPHTACGCDSLAVNDHNGPASLSVLAGKFTLTQTFRIAAHSDCCLFKRPSAEFAPDPALDPLWISYFDPFHGVKKDSFGFQVVLKVAAEEEKGGKEADKLPPPKP
jgi:hypothetical protein